MSGTGLGGTAKGMTQLIVAIVVCILIVSKFMGAVDINETESPDAFAAAAAIETGFWDAFGFWPIVLIVIMAVILLRVTGRI